MNQLKALAALAIGAGALFACSESSELPIAPEDMPIQIAKGGNLGGGGGTSTDTDPTATFYFRLPQGVNGLWSDGGYVATEGPHTGLSRYEDGKCGVQAKIYATDDASGSGDATMNLRRSNGAKCNPFPRKLTITYADSTSDVVEAFVIVDNLHREASSPAGESIIAVGDTVQRGMNVSSWSGGRCEVLRFRAVLRDETDTGGADPVNVTRINASTWRIWNAPGTLQDPTNQARCEKPEGTVIGLVTMPVDYYIVASRDLTM